MPKSFPQTNQAYSDIVFTPNSLAKDIIDHYKPKGKVLDPCRGMGAFYDQLPGKKDWCEYEQGPWVPTKELFDKE